MRKFIRGFVVILILGSTSLFFQNCGDGFQASTLQLSADSASVTDPAATNTTTGGQNPVPPVAPPPPPPPPLQNLWTKITPANPTTYYNSHAFTFGSSVLLFGRANQNPNFTGAIFDLTKNSFKTINPNGALYLRDGVRPVWTGSQVLIFGGSTALNGVYTYRRDGAIYDVVTDTWKPMNMTGAPSARDAAILAWAGARLIVYKGFRIETASIAYANDGGIYNPATDTWNTMNPAPFPIALNASGTGASGDKLLIFGGYDANSQMTNICALFDVPLNTWKACSTTNAPSARISAKVLWTGSKFIVWGGSRLDGAIYDPATDTWKTMTSPVVPPGSRSYEVTLNSTKDKMIVFGSELTGASGDYGAIYDLVTDSWQPMNMTNSPLRTSGYASTWTDMGWFLYGGTRFTNGNSVGVNNEIFLFK